jgi:hypothetical protein
LPLARKKDVAHHRDIVRQAETADFRKLMFCQLFSTDVKKTLAGSELFIHRKLRQI